MDELFDQKKVTMHKQKFSEIFEETTYMRSEKEHWKSTLAS